jgi:hypothetical protein
MITAETGSEKRDEYAGEKSGIEMEENKL